MTFRCKRVLVIGEVFKDEFLYGDINRISPESLNYVLDIPDPVPMTFLGGAGNAAANIKSLAPELEVNLCSLFSEQDADLLYINGLNDSFICWQQEPIITKTRYVAQNFKQQVLRVDSFQYSEPNKKIFQKHILTQVHPENFDLILISDYCKGLITEEIAQFLCLNNSKVLVDTKKKYLECFRGALTLKINHKEFVQCFHDYKQSLSMFSFIVHTKGKDGIELYAFGRKVLDLPAFSLDENIVRDITGAGDVVAATIVKNLAIQEDDRLTIEWWEHILKEATAAAGISIQKAGTCLITKQDLIENFR